MASLHKNPDCKNWLCAFYLPDGRRTMRSTGTPNKKAAWSICLKMAEASEAGKAQRLTEARARQTIADIFAIANADKLPGDTVEHFIASWLQRKSVEVAESSLAEYTKMTELLLAFLGSKAQRSMDSITRTDAGRFRDSLAKRVSPATCNKYMKIARIPWAAAMRDGIASVNPFLSVSLMKKDRDALTRRAFTLPELKSILVACDDDWRGLVLLGLYTGQRLGDCASLTWRQIDFEQNEVRFSTQKTGRKMHIPLADPLREYLLSRPSADDPDQSLFPSKMNMATGTLGNQFNMILANAGLVERRTHAAKKSGRSVRRAVGGLSFHCLRHTATSLLKNAGVSDVVAREIIGHDTEAISRSYTHIERDTLRAAVRQLPDVTK